MRFRLKLMFLMFLLFIISLNVVVESAPVATSDPLSRAMEATGANVEEFSINSWVKLPSGQLDNFQLEEIVEQVMTQLGVPSQDYELLHQQQKEHKSVQAEVITKDFHALVIAQVVPGGIHTAGLEGYLVVNIESKDPGNLSVRDMQDKITHITNNFGPSPQINTCLIGWLGGKLMDGEWHMLLSDAFKVIDGIIVDKLEAEHFASYTGFTSEIADWLQVDGKKINLNMAMRYSQYDNRTYVTIGSPIITREY